MKTRNLKFAIIILTLAILILISGCNRVSHVCIEGECINVEIVDTPEERRMGLMNRESLEGGMLFVFDKEEITGFWMRDTLIPLDMIWIDSSGTIVYIQKNALPCMVEDCPVYSSTKPAKYVLEVNGGYSDQLGLDWGDKVEIFT